MRILLLAQDVDRRLTSVERRTDDEAAAIENELRDRFGELPTAARNLLWILRLRLLAALAVLLTVGCQIEPIYDVDRAIDLFNRYSPQFIASLVTEDEEEGERFYLRVNAPFVGDGETRWVDGQKALLQPELGLSNWQYGRLFGRGGVLSGDSVYTVRTRARTRPGA